ncbi:MAG: hypothetical protein B6D46_13435 [Polyangiaceae bacterium UTPRO1]|nr:restriction endonuclease subunit S [Myxococcales bacterium]OQY65701.1 MAG: hypothetical protein B6D46_13435 [Polyangiaceae bacterium UTPRO1]
MSEDARTLDAKLPGRFKPYPTYKDSGVEWLGEIPVHWEVKRLKALASVQLSNVDKKSVEGQETVRLCNYTDVYYNERITPELDFMAATATQEQVRRFSLRAGDVLITKDSESWTDIAVPAVVSENLPDVLCGYHLAHIRPTDGVIGEFLSRTFSAIGLRDQFQIAANGITRFGLGGDAIRTGMFAVPPEPEQRAIAAFLDRETARIDALMAKKERLIELLQEKRTALITRAVTRGLDPTVPMKDSGVEWLGEIPAHWEVGENRWLFRESDSRSLLGEEELLTVSHITGVTRRSEKPNVTMIEAESHEGYKICRQGELAINTMWAWMGALGIAREPGMVSPSYNVFSIASVRLVGAYYDYLCRIPLHVNEIIRRSKGIWHSRLRLYPDAFRDIQTPLPSKSEQRTIAAFLDRETARIDALIAKIRDAIDRLKELRTALISVAVTGKIDVREEAIA